LVALVRFLYPGQVQQILPGEALVERLGRDPGVLLATHAAMRRYFVRTRKSELRLPPTEKVVVCQPMGVVQRAIYAALVGRYRGAFSLATDDRRALRDLGRIVMYLLEAATNPMLLLSGADADDGAGFQHPPLEVKSDERIMDLLHRYPTVEMPWKYAHIKSTIADAAARGEKVLVWSSFVRNLKYLGVELAEWNPAIVHGGIPPLDGAPPSATVVREQELDRFRHDPRCAVLLANPAACGEGVSLHHWCHHAVYLDRTFNAGHFLQSEDRIHRLGLADGAVTKFTFLLSENSIDTSVDRRLAEKIRALSVLMDDAGLVQVALPETDEDSSELPASDDDRDVVVQHVLQSPP
jgi:SNF2 family DNA or RNA helicase